MSHFRPISSNEILNGPVDYCTPIGDSVTFLCSKTAAAALDKARPAGKSFTADCTRNVKWFDKFCQHVTNGPDYVKFAKGRKTDRWYAQAVYL